MKEEIEFFDVKSKRKFRTSNWRIEKKVSGKRTSYFAVAAVPGASHEAWKIVSKDFGARNM